MEAIITSESKLNSTLQSGDENGIEKLLDYFMIPLAFTFFAYLIICGVLLCIIERQRTLIIRQKSEIRIGNLARKRHRTKFKHVNPVSLEENLPGPSNTSGAAETYDDFIEEEETSDFEEVCEVRMKAMKRSDRISQNSDCSTSKLLTREMVSSDRGGNIIVCDAAICNELRLNKEGKHIQTSSV